MKSKNLYQNEIKIDSGEDMTDEELEIYNHIKEQSSELLIRHASEQIAYTLKMYLKYDCIGNCSYEVNAKTILEDTITGIATQIAIATSKIVLKEKYDISIKQLNPLILSSSIPFNEINEEY